MLFAVLQSKNFSATERMSKKRTDYLRNLLSAVLGWRNYRDMFCGYYISSSLAIRSGKEVK